MACSFYCRYDCCKLCVGMLLTKLLKTNTTELSIFNIKLIILNYIFSKLQNLGLTKIKYVPLENFISTTTDNISFMLGKQNRFIAHIYIKKIMFFNLCSELCGLHLVEKILFRIFMGH